MPGAATTMLMLLCLAAYALLGLSGGQWLTIDAGELIRLGGSYAPAIAAGETWRLATAIFLHGGALHLGVNLLALRDIGAEVERRDGPASLLAVFLVTGGLGFFASALGRPEAVSVGASGGILGLVGHWGVALWRGRGLAPADRRGRLAALAVYLALIFGMGLLVPGIDQWAHLGGLLGGAALALLRRPGGTRRVFWVACLLMAAGLPLATRGFPARWQVQYEEHRAFVALYQAFAVSDRQINERLRTLGEASREGRLSDAEALAVLDREILPRLAENRRHWHNARFASPRLDAERQMWAQYALLRDEAVQALREAAATGSPAALARFRARMDEAARLAERSRQAAPERTPAPASAEK